MNVEKMVRDGRVAVLYSPGFGAGWSTWSEPEYRDFAMFDKELVGMVESGNLHGVAAYILSKLGANRFYIGGLEYLKICWVKEGARFIIKEYDGSESVKLLDDREYFVA